jgi:hypothetical protein
LWLKILFSKLVRFLILLCRKNKFFQGFQTITGILLEHVKCWFVSGQDSLNHTHSLGLTAFPGLAWFTGMWDRAAYLFLLVAHMSNTNPQPMRVNKIKLCIFYGFKSDRGIVCPPKKSHPQVLPRDNDTLLVETNAGQP